VKKLISLFFLFQTGLLSVIAQQRDVKALTSEKRHELAEKLIKQGGYYAAIDHMKDLVEKHPDDQTYLFKLAEAYFHSRDYVSAEKWYAKLTETAEGKKRKKAAKISMATFHYGEALKYNGKYDQAREVFDIFTQSNYRDIKGESYKAWAKNEVLSCEFALKNKDRTRYAQIANLDSNVNSGYSDFAPRLKDDSTLIYSSIQEDSVISVRHGDKHFEHTKIFASSLRDSAWQLPEEVGKVNSVFEHSGNGTYSPDGERFYFTRCRPIAGKMKCQIYVSLVTDKGLSSPKKLAGHANHAAHTCTQPFAVKIKTGKTEQEVLFFVSDMKGTVGGLDIWYSVIDKDGKAGKPANLGKNINSTRDEVAPYYDAATSALYFSSNYHFGFGGFDIFRAVGIQNKYSKPENLLRPVNSNLDDTYYTPSKNDHLKGFLVSNRPGGMALLSATCCDDIYSFQYTQPTILVVNVKDSLTGQIIENATLSMKSLRYTTQPDSILFSTLEEGMDGMEPEENVTMLENLRLSAPPQRFYVLEPSNLVNIKADAKGYETGQHMLKSDKQGMLDSIQSKQGAILREGNPRYAVLTLLLGKPKVVEPVEVEKTKDTVRVASSLRNEFEKAVQATSANEKLSEASLVKETAVSPTVVPDVPEKKVVLAEFVLNLRFQYDKAEIIEADQSKLDSLVSILKAEPKIRMDFTTHTDWIGSDEYNFVLSYKRAAFVRNYIVSKGIAQKRLKGVGMGEKYHIAPNAKADGSDDPDGRQANRRTEIKLIRGT
jgi:outer membrane protein OmpA-like peptidoglycan-associated protein/tetratricopeptide (TPR) repeat protein